MLILLFVFSLTCFFEKNRLNEQVLKLSLANSELEQKLKIYNKKNDELKNEIETFCKMDEQSKHPIDVELDNCINTTHPYMYSDCAKKNAENWAIEIEKQLDSLKKIMNSNEYKIIAKAQADWNKLTVKDEQIISEFVTNQQGQINETLGFSYVANLKKQRALFLNLIYFSYKDKLSVEKEN